MSSWPRAILRTPSGTRSPSPSRNRRWSCGGSVSILTASVSEGSRARTPSLLLLAAGLSQLSLSTVRLRQLLPRLCSRIASACSGWRCSGGVSRSTLSVARSLRRSDRTFASPRSSLGAAADALLALLALRPGALAGRAALGGGLLGLAPQVLEQAAAEQHLALLVGEVVGQLELAAVVLDLRADRLGAALELVAQLRQLPALADLGLVVVGLVDEGQRDDPLRDEVAPVDARERLGDHRANAELQRRQGGVLARRALAVVVAADDEAAAPLADPLAELGIAVAEGELGDRGDIGAVGHDLDAVGGEVAGRDVVVLDGGDPALERVAERLVIRRRLDVRPARNLDPLGLALAGGGEDVDVVDVALELGRPEQLGRIAVLARVGDPPAQQRHRRDRRRAQVHAVARGPRAAAEVAVEGAQRVGVRRRRLAHADARPAHRLEHPHAAGDELRVDAGRDDRRLDLARPRGGGGIDARVHDLAVLVGEDRAREREVGVGRVDRRAQADLGDLEPGHLLDGHDVVRVVGLGDERAERREVDLHALVVLAADLGADLAQIGLAP